MIVRLLPLGLVACITALPEVDDPCAEWVDPGLYSLKVAGRTSYIDVPATEGPRPAVIVLHGATESGQQVREITRFDVLGSDAGFVTVFPNGTGQLGVARTWNADGCCPPAIRAGVDDVAYLDELALTVSERVCTDRTFAAGFSNGAMMALRWACQSSTLDAVVASSGPLMTDVCDAPPIPTFVAHGLKDVVVPFEGGTFNNDGVHVAPSGDQTLSVFLEKNGCTGESVLEERADGVVCEVFACDVPVERCTLRDLGHRWPGGVHAELARFDLTLESLDFFRTSSPP